MTSSAQLMLYTEGLWDSPYISTAFVALTEKLRRTPASGWPILTRQDRKPGQHGCH